MIFDRKKTKIKVVISKSYATLQLTIFYLKSCMYEKLCLNFQIQNSNFSNDYGWRTTKIKVVDLKKLCNFVVDNVYI